MSFVDNLREGFDNFVKKVRDGYFSMEDKYYDFLDSLEQKNIPVYKVVDPIDKYVPSFALFLTLGVLIVLWLALMLLGFGGTNLYVKVIDAENAALKGVLVTVKLGETKIFEGQTDTFGSVVVTTNKGDSLSITAELKGYATGRKEHLVEKTGEEDLTITLLSEEAGYTTRVIKLIDQAGNAIIEPLTLKFACTNPYAEAPGEKTVYTGEVSINVPENCEKLTMSVEDSATFKGTQSIEVGDSYQVIKLEGEDAKSAKIVVEVTSNGEPADQIKVELYKYSELAFDPNVGPIDVTITSNGRGTFEVLPGAYVVKTFDIRGIYGEEESSRFDVSADETETVEIDLTEEIVGQVIVQVVDRLSGQPVDNAKVTLLYASNSQPVTSLITEASDNAIVSFPVSKKVEYKVVVEAEDYALGKKAGLTVSGTAHLVELEKCTPVNCGLFTVKVVDQDNEPIENATVALYDDNTKFLAGYSTKTTGLDGTAKFSNVKTGRYFAFAFKGGFSGKSDAVDFTGRTTDVSGVDLIVELKVEDGSLAYRVVDSEGEPLKFVQVDIYDARDENKLGSDLTDGNGTYELITKADKKVYLRFSSPEMADYTTVARTILPGVIQTYTIEMQPEIIDREAEVEFLGLFMQEKMATVLAGGQTYTGKWLLKIPSGKNYSEAGIHVRTGDDLIIEKDDLYIKEVNIPAAGILKATSFDEESGLDTGQYNLTNGDAKWANAVWQEPEPGIYEIEARIHVKPKAKVGDELAVHYRAWAEGREGRVRDPTDDLIESFELYDNTYRQVYQVGVNTLCDNNFCFTATILDIEEGLIENVVDVYQAKIFNEYELRFSITNNSEYFVHNNANVRITNYDESTLFTTYTIYDAETTPHFGVLNDFEFPRIDVGVLDKGKMVTGTIRFITQKAFSGIINIRLVSDQEIAFEKNLNIAIAAPKELDLLVSRTILPSGVETDLNVQVKDKATLLELENAIIRLKDRRGNAIMAKLTNKAGKALLTAPAMKPGEKLYLEVEKVDYDTRRIELKIESRVLVSNPSEIGVALNVKNKLETENKFTLTNVTKFPLTISKIELVGDFDNVLDEDQIKNWLEGSYLGNIIEEGKTDDFTLRSFLSEDGKKLTEREDFDAHLLIDVSNFGQKWTLDIPVKVAVGLGPEVDDPNCLVLTRNSWEAATQGNPVSVEFQIQNNCTINGTPIPLKELSARVNLLSNQLGIYTLAIGTQETELRSFYFRKITNEVEPEVAYSAILTFTPFSGIDGLQEGDVVIQAVNPLEDKDQILSATIKTKIAAVNLKDCVLFDRHIIRMKEEESTTFNIKTKGCGGPTQFELESDLTLSQKEFVIQDDSEAQVEVFAERNIPGQYPVFVNAKGPNQKQMELLKNIRARVLVASGCIDLSRYEFDVYDDPNDTTDGVDTVKVINICPDKKITAKFKTPKDFMESLKKAITIGAVVTVASWLIEKVDDNRNKFNDLKADYDKSKGKRRKTEPTQRRETGTTIQVATTQHLIVLQTSPAGAANIFGGGVGGSIFGAGTSILNMFFGSEMSAPAKGISAALITLLFDYVLSEEDTGSLTLVKDDLSLSNFKLLTAPSEEGGLEDQEVKLTKGKKSTSESRNAPGLKVAETQLVFRNMTGFTTEKEKPKYKFLDIGGKHKKYNTEKRYEFDPDEDDIVKVDELSSTSESRSFRLEFNSVSPEREITGPVGMLDCQVGTKSGSTGVEALPEIKLAWDWQSIAENECDVDNSGSVYCDATQFSITLLKKIQSIRTFIESNAPFKCPSALEAVSTRTAEIAEFDIGISKISTEKVLDDTNVIVEVTNTNPRALPVSLEITAQNIDGNTSFECQEDLEFNVLSREKVGCLFSGLPSGLYKVTATLETDLPDDCEDCEDQSVSNSIVTTFDVGGTGLEVCEPFSTKRLDKFLAASGVSGTSAENILKKVNFRAKLIRDRYTKDFQQDFDEFSLNQSFFNAPSYYKDASTGLTRFFRDSKLFGIKSKFDTTNPEGYLLPGPGIYNVTIDIEFDNKDWRMFDGNNESATITVELDKADAPELPSPLYYMPFNGLIGESNGRIGYGLNYRGDKVRVNNAAETVNTIEIAGSTPIPNGILEVKDAGENFKKLNIDERGVILKVVRLPGLKMTYSPSYATPVLLKIKNERDEAWAFYSVGVDGAAVNTGNYLNRWNGVGYNCKSFDDKSMIDAFYNSPDLHGLDTECALVGGDIAPTTYGFEFCRPVNFGKVVLKSVFYTPQNRESNIKLMVSNDSAELIGETVTGSTIPLNGVSTVPFNSFGGSNIESLQNILDLVSQRHVCVSGTDNIAEFWWNPKSISDALLDKELSEEAGCIQRS